jgi:tRNA dimethylallyltransferase
MVTDLQKPALLIAGPTASGKSALALNLAQERKGVIINADALQVYSELRILTARPPPEDEAAAPHRLYGHVSGRHAYSVAHWLADAEREIHEAWEHGLLPIVTGGTGLYFKMLEQGLAPVPPIDADIRKRWREFSGDLHGMLSKRDRPMAERLNPADRQRIIRALEVVEGTGRSLLDWQQQGQSAAVLAGAAVEHRFLDMPRAELYARAGSRFDQMMEAGALEELEPIADLDPALPMMRAIGVPELLEHLKNRTPVEEAVVNAKTATRHYIKRQATWWRSQMKHWHDSPESGGGSS